MRNLFLSLSVLLLVAFAGGSSFVDAQPGGGRRADEVLVVNDASTAVPTQAVGTTAVSGSVTIANGAAAPVLVRNVDIPAAPIPFVIDAQLIIDPGEEFELEQLFSVPLDQRLVVETFTMEGSAPTGQVLYEATILGSTEGVGAIFRFPFAAAPKTHLTFDRFTAVQQTRINVRGGAGLIVSASRTGNTGTSIVNVAISGFLVSQ